MFLVLQRISNKYEGTYGNLLDEDFIPFLNTVERRWNNNKPCTCHNHPCTCNSSCIPQGIYRCKRHITTKGRETFQLINVKKRTHINFDIANTKQDLHGCIGLGKCWGTVNGIRGVHQSRRACRIFMNKLRKVDTFILIIINQEKNLY